MKRNVLLVLTDEHRFDAVGFNGNPLVRTPHLDALAAESINFRQHTCSSPICTPARASILTGRYARTHGAIGVGHTLAPETPTLATWLSQAGYACGLFGKSHLEPEQSGFQEQMGDLESYYGFTHFALSEDNLLGPYMDWIRAEHPEYEEAAWTQGNEDVQRPRIPWDHGTQTRLNAVFPSPLPAKLSQSFWITRQTERFIREQTAAETPFFAVCSFVPPHHPYTPPEPYASMYDPASLPVPRRLPADHRFPWKPHPYWYLPQLPDSEFQRYLAAYYGLVTMLDDCVGQLQQTLRECGADEDTLIVFTSDHGDYGGRRGLIRKLGPLYDDLLHVPLLVRVPGHPAAGSQRQALTQHEDLAPTILDLLGQPIPGSAQGQSFTRSLEDPSARPRQHAFVDFMLGVYGVSNDRWKLLRYKGDYGTVLTDRESDPEECRNLAGAEEHVSTRQALERELFHWLLDTPPYMAPINSW